MDFHADQSVPADEYRQLAAVQYLSSWRDHLRSEPRSSASMYGIIYTRRMRLESQSHTLTANADSSRSARSPRSPTIKSTTFTWITWTSWTSRPALASNCFHGVHERVLRVMSYGSQFSEELRDVFHPVSNVEWLVGVFAQTWTANSGDGGGITLLPFATTVRLQPRQAGRDAGRCVPASPRCYWDITDRSCGCRPALRGWPGTRCICTKPTGTTRPSIPSSRSWIAALGFKNLNGRHLPRLKPGQSADRRPACAWVNYGGKIGLDLQVHRRRHGPARLLHARGFKTTAASTAR